MLTDEQQAYMAEHYNPELRGSVRVLAMEMGLDYQTVLNGLKRMGIYRKCPLRKKTEEYKAEMAVYRAAYKHVYRSLDRGVSFEKSPAEYAAEALEAYRNGVEYVLPTPSVSLKRGRPRKKPERFVVRKEPKDTVPLEPMTAKFSQEDFDRLHAYGVEGDAGKPNEPETARDIFNRADIDGMRSGKVFARSKYHSTPQRPGILTHGFIPGVDQRGPYQRLLAECLV